MGTRRPSLLLVHEGLHMVGMGRRLRLRIGVRGVRLLRQPVGRHVRAHIRRALGVVVHGLLRYEGKAVHRSLLWMAWRTDRLADHVRAHSPEFVPRRRPRPHGRLRRVPSRAGTGVSAKHAVRYRGRRRRRVVPKVGELRLRLEVRREHLGVHPVALRRSAVVVLRLGPGVEIGRALVFIGTAVLSRGLAAPRRPRRAGREGTYICVPRDHLPHVGGRVLVQLLVGAEDDDGDVNRAEHRQLVGLFEEATLSFQKGAGHERQRRDRQQRLAARARAPVRRWEGCLHRTVSVILDGLDLDLPAAHLVGRATAGTAATEQ